MQYAQLELADVERPYDRDLRLVLLKGPNGPLLAHYVTPEIPPDRHRHRFLVCYEEPYVPATVLPPVVPADLRAFAMAINYNRDVVSTVESGVAGEVGASEPTERDMVLAHGESVPAATGVAVRPGSVHISAGEGSLSVDRQGVHVRGPITISEPEQRGPAAQSPVWGLMPKTVVTFWAADYLPDLSRINALLEMIRDGARLLALIAIIVDMLTGD